MTDGEQKLVVTKDDNVRLIINSDKDLVMHVHGYDIEKNVKANQETYLDFHAHATGRFLVNTHELADEVHGHHHSSHEKHSIDPLKHGEIFMTTILSLIPIRRCRRRLSCRSRWSRNHYTINNTMLM